MRIRMLAILCAATLAGCAVQPPARTPVAWQQVKAGIPPGSALLYIVRPEKPAGRENLYRISINGTPVADLPTGTYVSRVVASGAVRVEARIVPSVTNIRYGLPFLERPELMLAAQPGEIAFVRVGVSPEQAPTLAQVNAATGEALAEQAQALPHREK